MFWRWFSGFVTKRSKSVFKKVRNIGILSKPCFWHDQSTFLTPVFVGCKHGRQSVEGLRWICGGSCIGDDVNQRIRIHQLPANSAGDLFGMVTTWPLQSLSDLQLGDKKAHFESPGGWVFCSSLAWIFDIIWNRSTFRISDCFEPLLRRGVFGSSGFFGQIFNLVYKLWCFEGVSLFTFIAGIMINHDTAC